VAHGSYFGVRDIMTGAKNGTGSDDPFDVPSLLTIDIILKYVDCVV